MLYIHHEVQIETLKINPGVKIYYARFTCWWTNNPLDLYSHPDSNLPVDPRGSVLFEMSDPLRFLESAEKTPDFYGKYGLRAFMLGYHGCVQVRQEDGRSLPTSLEKWQEYNDLIDGLVGRVQ